MQNIENPENIKMGNDEQLNDSTQYHQILTFKTNKLFCSFVFNNDCSILFAGIRLGRMNRIQLFGFNNRLKLIQNFPKSQYLHGSIFNLTFIKKTSQLLSSYISSDNLIIWKQNQNNQWTVNQEVPIKQMINHIALNQNEDLLIVGCLGLIVFLKNVNLGWICLQRIYVLAQHLSINQSSTKLISGFLHDLRVIELQPDQQWIITQSIQGNYQCAMCFINDNQFICQQRNKDFLELYYQKNHTLQLKVLLLSKWYSKNYQLSSLSKFLNYYIMLFLNNSKFNK